MIVYNLNLFRSLNTENSSASVLN